MELPKLLSVLLAINFASSEQLECSLINGIVLSTYCRITSGSIAVDEELKISNAFNNLTLLTLSNVNFEKIPKNIFTLYPKIITLYISFNNLNQLAASDFSNAKNLKILTFYINSLSTIQSRVFEQCSILDTLTISDNPTTEIKEEAFYGLKTLKSLTLSNLPLQSFQPTVLKDLPSLQNLRMINCSLTAITKDFFSFNQYLTSIAIGSNLIEYVEEGTFEKLPNISSVDLSYNKLVSFSSANILYATLSINLLKSLHIGSRTLTLTAEGNLISNLTCDENLSLQHLNLINNSLSKLACIKKMSHLYELQLLDNKIGRVNKNIFANNQNVTNLRISGNPKLKLSSKMIAPMSKLLRLQVDNFVNGYKMLNTTFPTLYAIYLNTKNWNCNRVKNVAAILNSQKIYIGLANQYTDFDKNVCNLTAYQINKL